MPDQSKSDGVFISCVSDEFEKDGAPFPGLRGQLRGYLARTRVNVRVQEDFPQTAVDTVKKLADEVHPRAIVIHLVGEKPGAIGTLTGTFRVRGPAKTNGHPPVCSAPTHGIDWRHD